MMALTELPAAPERITLLLTFVLVFLLLVRYLESVLLVIVVVHIDGVEGWVPWSSYRFWGRPEIFRHVHKVCMIMVGDPVH